MEWTEVFFRTLFIYFFVLIVMRLMGKREIGKLSVFDLVVSIMIADLAVISIENGDRPMVHGDSAHGHVAGDPNRTILFVIEEQDHSASR